MVKKYANKHPSKKAEKPLSKAGVMMFEDTPDGRKLLVAYNEGRFAKNGRYLVLPKGSIDEGESVARAGLREFSEETGFALMDVPACSIDGVHQPKIDGFLTEQQVVALEQGMPLRNITNRSFPEFEIVEFNPEVFLHEYHARSGATHKMAMFGVEVRGLDAIAHMLKNPHGKTTKDLLDANRDVPRFPTFFEWLKQGYIPADGDLPRVALCEPKWLAAKVNAFMPSGIEVASEGKSDWDNTRVHWQKFCRKMEKDGDYKTLRQAFHAIKQRMVDKGFVQGDNAALKFDEKDCPLFWYTEGGVIDYARPILAQTFADMDNNNDYARAFGGAGSKVMNWGPAKKATLGQVAGYKDFVTTDDWLGASVDAHGKVKPIANNLARLKPIAASFVVSDEALTPAQARA